jgi:3-phosphoshikimate 1-carboxyvinyltransferase
MVEEHPPEPLALAAPGSLAGTAHVPGDKSISHRALMFPALAVGRSDVTGLLESEDVFATAAALRAMGVQLDRVGEGHWTIDGVGVGGLLQPRQALDMGNSGTSTRLLMGLVASHPLQATFVGDASLSRRPMGRVIEPLSRMGAEILASPGGLLPLTVRGIAPALPLDYRLPVASAQVKSAILLAGLNAAGTTRVVEPLATRDHSERLLDCMGAAIRIDRGPAGERVITIDGEAELRPVRIEVPADPSSAAFPMVAALIVPGSRIKIPSVGLNPTRDGLLRTLLNMGARIEQQNPRQVGGEPVADLVVEASELQAVETGPQDAPAMIDEFPILFVAAALARGRSVFRGLEELRVKESDRLSTMAAGLVGSGVSVEELPDGLAITGTGGEAVAGGSQVAVRLDHRIAMSFCILSLVARRPVLIDDARPIATSFPGFLPMMEAMGATRRQP